MGDSIDKGYLTLPELERSRDSLLVRSSRSLSVDWSRWEEHVFFGSARARLDSTVDWIQGTFPFDGTREQVNEWNDNLTGWQDWLLRTAWPSNLRSLELLPATLPAPTTDPNMPSPARASIYTVDFQSLKEPQGLAGLRALTIEERGTIGAQNRLNPKEHPLTIELWMNGVSDKPDSTPSVISNHRNVDGEGWTLLMLRHPDGYRLAAHLAVDMGSAATNYALCVGETQELIPYDEWHHVAFRWNSAEEGRELSILLDCVPQPLINTENTVKLTQGVWNTTPLDPHWIGWGPSPQLNQGGDVYSPLGVEATGGYRIDEYRVWHRFRTEKDITLTKRETLWATDGLVLQYRFNDSPEMKLTFEGQALYGVLDSSGNRLHGQRQPDNRAEGMLIEQTPPALKERKEEHPTIYPIDSSLLATLSVIGENAREYDEANPNLITKLVPRHYLENPIDASRLDLQGSGELAEAMDGSYLFAALLYTWADFWDDLKLRADSLAQSMHLNPDGTGSAGPLLPELAKEWGMTLPMLFERVLPSQWDESFSRIQEDAWRRVLVALPDVLRRKGTVAGIRGLLSAIGTSDTSGNLRVREYGTQDGHTKDALELVESKVRFVKYPLGTSAQRPTISFTNDDLV